MYKVFFNDREIIITSKENRLNIKTAIIIEDLRDVNAVINWFKEFEKKDQNPVILIHSNPIAFWERCFLPAFILVPAAGGVVVRSQKLLFIFRNQKWDLPKGKIDKGETPIKAAIREVNEECGISGHEIVKHLPSTFHIYKSPYKKTLGQWILKETFWFEMSYSGVENGTPQTEENITKVQWFAKNELDTVLGNTYENLKQLIKIYLPE